MSHSNFEEISPKLDNWMVLEILEFITTVPKPTVSYINFIYIPWAVVKTFSSFLFSWLSTILYINYALKGLILIVGLNETYKSYFSRGFMIMVWVGETLTFMNIFFNYSSCWSTLNEISIFFFEWFIMPIMRVSSCPTLVIPKSTFWSYVFSTSNLSGMPSPLILTWILFKLLISKVSVYWYLIISLGVNTIGIRKTFFYTLSTTPFLFFTEAIYNGKTT